MVGGCKRARASLGNKSGGAEHCDAARPTSSSVSVLSLSVPTEIVHNKNKNISFNNAFTLEHSKAYGKCVNYYLFLIPIGLSKI